MHVGRRTLLNVHKDEPQSKESTTNASRSGTKSDMGAKGKSTADEDEFSEMTKLQNASIACGPTALVLKKVRHAGQRHSAHFDLVNPDHADFNVSNSLCSKNRVPACCGVRNKNNTNNNKDFGTKAARRHRFPSPHILLVYGTHNQGGLRKISISSCLGASFYF